VTIHGFLEKIQEVFTGQRIYLSSIAQSHQYFHAIKIEHP
jgi:hypothetical protein